MSISINAEEALHRTQHLLLIKKKFLSEPGEENVLNATRSVCADSCRWAPDGLLLLSSRRGAGQDR